MGTELRRAFRFVLGGALIIATFAFVVISGVYGTANLSLEQYQYGPNAIPDLRLTKTADRFSAQPGDVVTFTMRATLGNPTLTSGASNVRLTDPLPANVTPLSVDTNRGSCTLAQTVTCNLDFLSGTLTAVVRLTVRVSSQGAITNTASVRADEPDSSLFNNTATARVADGTPPPPPPPPPPPRGMFRIGTDGSEILVGDRLGDVLRGLGSADILQGLDGRDVLVGGDGLDVLEGGKGRDFLQARDGGPDLVDCGPDRDVASVDREDTVIDCEKVLRAK